MRYEYHYSSSHRDIVLDPWNDVTGALLWWWNNSDWHDNKSQYVHIYVYDTLHIIMYLEVVQNISHFFLPSHLPHSFLPSFLPTSFRFILTVTVAERRWWWPWYLTWASILGALRHFAGNRDAPVPRWRTKRNETKLFVLAAWMECGV